MSVQLDTDFLLLQQSELEISLVRNMLLLQIFIPVPHLSC